MPLTLTTWARLSERVRGDTRLGHYSGGETSGSHPNVTAAITAASDMFRSAAVNRYTEASIDALTSETIPGEAQYHIESLVLGILTGSDEVQPETIAKAADLARQWLGFLAGGSAHVEGLTPLSSATAGGSGSGSVRYAAPESREFDRDSTNQRFAARFPRI